MTISRKNILSTSAKAGLAGLAGLKLPAVAADKTQGALNGTHHQPKAKRMIYMFQSGGPSHVDLLDHKPIMKKLHGKELPSSVRGEQRLTGMTAKQKNFPVCASTKDFKACGKSGLQISDHLPYLQKIADKITIVNSVHTEAINHDPGITLINTGSQIPGGPSLGAWIDYGLGSLNQNLPGYVVLLSQGTGKNPGQPIFSRLWGSGFIPSIHQGVMFRSGENPILYLKNHKGISRSLRRNMLDQLEKLNHSTYATFKDPETLTRNAQYDMAYRMQRSAPEVVDFSNEPDHVFKLYGEDARTPGTYAYNCLLTRRLIEKDVRMVQLFHRGWDQHNSLQTHLPNQCKNVDQASAALVTDLEQRGLLEDTMLVWGGEFGRTPYSQGKLGSGRDHHGRCFSVWMAGGGIAGGQTYGKTDDYCYNIVENPVHINDLNATILHGFGINHHRLTYKYQGLDRRLTGVEEVKVVKELFA
jgi:hypothetical protein